MEIYRNDIKKINNKNNKNNNDNFTKLTQRYGISLITLVITIVVVIILAAAVVMSLNNNNVLTNASSARYETDRDTMQSYLELAIQKVSLRHQGTLCIDSGEVAMDATSNVKDSKGTITWKSTDIGNLSGEIIFDEGVDTDTTFYTGYKLPVYGSETKWYVHENGKLILQTGSRIYGADEIPSKTINARKILNNPQKYYGAYVNYVPYNTLSEEYKWRIFYATNENIFLISSDYINVDDLPTTGQGNKPLNENTNYPKAATFKKIINDYSGSTSIAEDMKWFNKDYFNNEYVSTNTNMRAVAYMLDKTIWTNKFIGNGIEYVIGGPSLEMVLTSYNQKNNLDNSYQFKAVSYEGYLFSHDNGENFYSAMSFKDTLKYLTKGEKLYNGLSSNSQTGYWLSTPSSGSGASYPYNTQSLYNISGNGSIHNLYYYISFIGFRPIICLKSNVKLKNSESEEKYEISLN